MILTGLAALRRIESINMGIDMVSTLARLAMPCKKGLI